MSLKYKLMFNIAILSIVFFGTVLPTPADEDKYSTAEELKLMQGFPH